MQENQKDDIKIVGGFVVVSMDNEENEEVCFCDSLKEAESLCDKLIEQGLSAKVFMEVL